MHVVVQAERDFYEILGVSRSAGAQDIKRAYRKLAREFHPDVNKAPGATEKFQDITAAYEALSDPEKKARYDQFGEAGIGGAAGDPFGGMGGMGMEDMLGEMFGSFFGGGMGGGGMGGRRAGPEQGDDLQMAVDIDFKSAIFGTNREIAVDRKTTCSTCGGSRIAPGSSMKTCSVCRGQGVTVQQVRSPLGVLQTQVRCRQCQGQGQVIEKYCDSCNGAGRLSERKTVSVKIPCGISDGSKLRISGAGDAGEKGGPPGDLYLVLRVQSDPKFTRTDTQISTEKQVLFTEAILGCTVQVDTVDGNPVSVNIPGGTQPGAKLRLRGKGVPALGKPDQRGDHIVTVKVSIPKTLTDEQRKQVEQLQEAMKVSALSAEEPSNELAAYLVPSLSAIAVFMAALICFKKSRKFRQLERGSQEPLIPMLVA